MAGIITNFQAPDTLKELKWFYDNYERTDLDRLFEGAKKHRIFWTVAKNSKIGDVVFFFCGATAINKLNKAYAEARKDAEDFKIVEFAEKEKELYEKFSGNILAWGHVASDADEGSDGRWNAEIEIVEALQHPIPYAAFKPFVKINTYSAITYLNDEQLDKLEKLAGLPQFL